MANQMIALQARNPQLPDPARQTAQMANMMNAAAQQRASQLQGQRIRQEMEYETELQAPKLAEASAKANSAQLTFVMDFYKKSADSLLNSSTPEQAVARGERLKSMFPVPALQAQIDETISDLVSDPSQFQAKRKQMLINTLDAKDQLAVEHSDIFDAEGNLLFKESSKVGAFPTRLTPGVVTDLPSTATRTTPAPRATPTAAAGTDVNMRATRGANTTPQDLMDQGMDPRNIPSGMPTSRPVSFNQSDMGGADAVQMTPDVMSRIVDSAFQTGVMAQVDFDQLLASQPPQNKQALMNAFRQAKITLQADAPSLAASAMDQQPMAANPVQTPQAEFAVYRGQPQEQTPAQYQVGQQVKGRNPNLSPYPGSAQVPIERVRQEAAAGRETANEVYAKELARARAARDAAKEAGPKPLTPVQEAKLRDNIAKDYKSARSTISMMLDPVSGVVASVNKVRSLSPSQKEAITGYSGYLPSITPGARSADTAIKNLRGKVTEMGKSAAALTGAIGQMAVQEWRIVSDMIASLDIEGMEPADLDNQLDIIEAQARRAAEVTRDAYENQYVEEFARYPGRFQLPSATGKTPVVSRPKAESQLPRIRGNADYNKLKPGTEFIDPNGVRRRKPK
jgi:hypothetical protein